MTMQMVPQGEFAVSTEEQLVLSCILGSCTAACLFDERTRVGGMNHIVLPDVQLSGTTAQIHGTHAMEVLINGLLKAGASRRNLQAKIFGGAQVIAGLSDVGVRNARFLQEFLAREGIPCVGESLGGRRGRRIQFWPTSGRARQQFLPDFDEDPSSLKEAPATTDSGTLDLF